MHSDSTYGKSSALLREVRKRTWWTLYAFERIECSSLGRPSAINDAELSVGLPTEGLLDMGDIFPLGYMEAQSQLSMTLGSISMARINIDEIKQSDMDFVTETTPKLQAWFQGLPFQLRWNPDAPVSHHRAIILLHIQYFYARTLLTRPLLAAKAMGKESAVASSVTLPLAKDDDK